ncbi:LamG-like jellyroll fold domain-containing protein [Sedimentisphaera salicampi]|uniref:LamG-like jellyroll fold domain-containing protein n=1 Tax=Sedimentisphaera salicampi TaxID=1941349 RepID=UPI000B9A2F7A|nr:LamG-like jellyroll fold domain-containing protein [Sedimentisphaera salicampi]OXU15515.1 Immunoglobulin I-set domain protein [Sedimentisphaera salicampi]
MSKTRFINLRVLFGLLAILGIANVAMCKVNAYDPFGYEPGQLFERSPEAYGFTGAWGDGGGTLSQCTVQPDSLVYLGAETAYQNSSGSFQVEVPAGGDGARLGRFFDLSPDGPFSEYVNQRGCIGKPGQTIYISYLMNTSKTDAFYAFELKRDSLNDEGAILYVGNDVADHELQVCAYRNKDTSESNLGVQFQWLGPVEVNTTELIVIRIDFGLSSDDVTVYRNPSLDAEPVMQPHLQGAGLLDFQAITMASWVNGERSVQFDEICVATAYDDAVRFYDKADRAKNPTPADGAVGIQGNQSVYLSWQAGAGVTPSSYKVYFSDNLSDVIAENDSAYQGTASAPNMTVDSIDTDTVYYWSVAQTEEPNNISGVVWRFETNKTLPVIFSQPAPKQVFAGEEVSFSVEVNTETTAYYQWYDDSGMLADGGDISGSQTSTLTLTNPQISDEGDYYCEITNNTGTVATNPASLSLKRLVGYWNLDQISDPNSTFSDLSGSGNDLEPAYNIPDTFTWTQGADGLENGALVFDQDFALGTKKPDGTMNDIPLGNQAYTISAWIKATEGNNQGIIGWGNYGTNYQCNALAINANPYWARNYWWSADLDASRDFLLTDDNWHQLVAAYDGDTRSIYIDGLLAASDNPVSHDVQTSENFLIGKTNTTSPVIEFFTGAIDEVKVYNYALTETEVAVAYTDIIGGSICVYPPDYDLNGDCRINIEEFSAIAMSWLECGLVPTCISEE